MKHDAIVQQGIPIHERVVSALSLVVRRMLMMVPHSQFQMT
jgi:hypothetical protein